MLHRPCPPSAFFSRLAVLDQQIADEVHAAGCQHCGQRLHVADYPSKPRGVARDVLGDDYGMRWSFCCANCRRRTTPPSLRFLGRRVYLGALVVLFGNLAVVPTPTLLSAVSARSGIPVRTLARWRTWWTNALPPTRWWRDLAPRFVPPIEPFALPLALLGRLSGADELDRLIRVLALASPLSTRTCSHLPRVASDTHEMC